MVASAACPSRAGAAAARAGRHHQRQRQLGRVRQQVLQQVQRAVVGPVQVFDQQHRQRRRLWPAPAGRRAGAQRPGRAGRAGPGRARCGLSPKSRPESWPMSCACGSPRSSKHGLRPSTTLRVATSALSVSATPNCVASRLRSRPHRRSRPSGCERSGQTRHRPSRRRARLQFAQQPALAQAGVAQQRQRLQMPGLAGLLDGVQQALQLGVAAHHRRGQALQPALDAGPLRSSAARTR
jgi:hypothetical protein